MMEKGLISIIIPCYNAEKYIDKCLQSVLNQTYKKLEVIIVNDGSTDNSEEKILSYKEKFKEEGMKFIYIKQENKGVSAAVNLGLKQFTGEFLCQPDSDDFLDRDAMKIRKDFLDKHQDYAAITCNANVYDENNLEKPLYHLVSDRDRGQFKTNQFERLIRGQSLFCPICHMIRSSAFLDVNPKREIYPSRGGQNFQMLLPVYYKHKRKFLNIPLANYVIHNNSLSRGDDTLKKKINRLNEHKTILIETIKSMVRMPEKTKNKYIKFATSVNRQHLLDVAIEYKDKELFNKTYFEIRKLGFYKIRSFIKYFIERMKLNYDR